jgi:hypothetical protein
MTENSGTAILARVIAPEKPTFSPDTAQEILTLDFAESDRKRMNELAAKARAGTLTDQENQDLENFLLVGHMLDLMHSKARMSLRSRTAGA